MENPTAPELEPLSTGEHPWARGLRRARKAAGFAELVLSLALTGILFSGPAEQWARFTLQRTESNYLRALIFSAGLGLVYYLVSFPVSYARGHLIEKMFELSTQSTGGWLSDQLKGLALGAVLGTMVVSGLTAILINCGGHWWWVSALAAAFFGVVLTRVAPNLIVPIFFKMKRIESKELLDRFSKLAAGTGTPVLGIFEIDMSRRTRAANAAVIGFGASRRAVVGDTLLKEFTHDEIEFVLAHELGHHKFHDLWSGVALSSALTAVSLLVSHMLLTRLEAFAVPFPPNEFNFNPIVLFWIAVLTSVLGALLGPLAKAFSRSVETRADTFASKATGNASSGAEAFRKLGYQNMAVFSPPRWEELLFYTHPSIGRRIARLSRTPDLT